MSENLFGLTVAADAAFAFAVSQFGKQLVVIESRLDLKLDRCKHIDFKFVLPRIWETLGNGERRLFKRATVFPDE